VAFHQQGIYHDPDTRLLGRAAKGPAALSKVLTFSVPGIA
jgi:hypothetical protein